MSSSDLDFSGIFATDQSDFTDFRRRSMRRAEKRRRSFTFKTTLLSSNLSSILALKFKYFPTLEKKKNS